MSTTLPVPNQDFASAAAQAQALLTQLIEKKPEADKLLAETVRLSGQALQAGGAAFWLTETPDNPELLLEHNLAGLSLMQDNQPLNGLLVAVRRAAREGKPLIVPAFFIDNEAHDLPVNPSPYELLFVGLRLHNKIALVLLMAVPPTMDAQMHRVQIQFLQKMLGQLEATLAERHLDRIEKDRGTAGRIVQFAEQVHKHLFVREVAIDIANLVRDVASAERIVVELYPRRRKKVLAVSNVDEPNKRAALLQAQRLVFDYVRDRNVPVVLDRAAAKQLVSDPLLQDAATAYFLASSFEAFLAAPIRRGDKVVGVILAEYATSQTAQQNSPLLSDLARMCATSVTNAMAYESIPLRRSLHALAETWRKPTSTKRYTFYSIAGLALAAILFLCVVPFDFAVKTDCSVQPVAQLGIVAPMEGRIIDVPVRAGEHVYAKADRAARKDLVKPLLVFDTTDLLASRAEQQQKEAELHVQLKETQDKGEISKIGALQLQLKQVEDQIKLLNHQIEQATVYSPIEGTVLTENIEQKKWASVRLGEPLLEVASFSDWMLMVDVPESEVAVVRDALAKASRQAINQAKPDAGIEVEYIFYPWPDKRYSIRATGIATLLPAASQSKNANVFRLQIPVNPAELPPGIAMSGVTGRAKIHVGRKPLMNQWTRGLSRLLKMTAFF